MMKRILKKLGFGKSKGELSEKFTGIYEKNLFKGKESISGPGSDLHQTRIIKDEIPKLLSKYGVHSMIDAPCGDLYWMRHVDLGEVKYTGLDIVQELIDINSKQFGSAQRNFQCLDIVNDTLPKADLIFCRDCLVHLSHEQALKALNNFARSGAEYLLTTTFPGKNSNEDLGRKIWRPLNLQLAPFSLPAPLELINEGCTEDGGIHADKSLGLWRTADIREALSGQHA